MRGTVQLVALSALLLVAAPAHAATPAAGKRYDGATTGGRPVVIRVAKDGSKLGAYEFRIPTNRCSDGAPWNIGLSSVGEGPAPIDATGAFAYASPSEPVPLRTRRGRRVTAHYHARFSGQFVGDGTTVQGTIQTTLTAPHLHCDSGAVPFTAYLDGSPNAPFQDANIISGTYSGSTSQGFGFDARVFLPAHAILSTTIKARARCPRSAAYVATIKFPQIQIGGDRSFATAGGFRTRLNGYRVTVRDRLTGTLQHTDHYSLSARFHLTATLKGHGRRAIHCSGDVSVADASYRG